jgi:hypothetical protein
MIDIEAVRPPPTSKSFCSLFPSWQEAINLGPNGADQWPTYEPRTKALGEFAKTLVV